MAVRPEDNDHTLDHAGDHGRNRGADHTHRRQTQLAENEKIVEHQIDKHRDDARLHRQQRLARFAQRAGIDLAERKERHLQHDRAQIALPVAERGREIEILLALVQEQQDQRLALPKKDSGKERHRAEGDVQLGAEGVAHALVVALAVKLGSEDPRAGETAEDAEIEHE